MKNYLMICLLVCGFIGFYSCGPDELDGLVASIAGEEFDSSLTAVYSFTPLDSVLIITGTSGGILNTSTLMLTVVDYQGEGSYEIDGVLNFGSYVPSILDTVAFEGISGNINLTSVTEDNIQGTFEFVGEHTDFLSGDVLATTNVEDGEFNITQ